VQTRARFPGNQRIDCHAGSKRLLSTQQQVKRFSAAVQATHHPSQARNQGGAFAPRTFQNIA